MIANVENGRRMDRVTLPRPIPVAHHSTKNVYIGRRTARMVIETRRGFFYFATASEYDLFALDKNVRAAIDAVKEPRPL